MRPGSPTLPGDLSQGLFQLEFRAMGTLCRLLIRTDSARTAAAYRDACLEWTRAFEAKYSRFLETSLISTINRAAGDGSWIDLDDEAEQLLALGDTMTFLSRGVLDPTSLPLTRLWQQAARQARLPTENALAETRALVGWDLVERRSGQIRLPREGMALDLGGYGKEYAVDAVAAMSHDFGVTDVLVDFGHDIRALGRPPDNPCWVIGVEDAGSPGKVWEKLGLSDRAVASSGNYQRYVEIAGERYGHILDIRTGWPVRHDLQGVTVIHPRCLEAGVLATSAFILGPHEGLDWLQGQFDVEASLQTTTRKQETRAYHRYVVQQEPSLPPLDDRSST